MIGAILFLVDSLEIFTALAILPVAIAVIVLWLALAYQEHDIRKPRKRYQRRSR